MIHVPILIKIQISTFIYVFTVKIDNETEILSLKVTFLFTQEINLSPFHFIFSLMVQLPIELICFTILLSSFYEL